MAKSRLRDFITRSADTVASMDPTGTMLKARGLKETPSANKAIAPPEIKGLPEEDMMARQNKIKKTFAKIPGR